MAEFKLLSALPFTQRKALRISTDTSLCVRHSSSASRPSPGSSLSTSQSATSSSTCSRPQRSSHVLCLHDFESSDPAHLPFHKGEVLAIVKQERSGWWAAMRLEGDRVGWIPSSFVLSLDRSEVVDYPSGISWCYEDLDDHRSAGHDLWVPVSDGDYEDTPFQLPTPTDVVLYKGFFDGRAGLHIEESLLNPTNRERSSDMGYVFTPLTPESPPPYRMCGPLLLPGPFLSEQGASQRTQPASPPLFDTEQYHHPHLYTVEAQISLLPTSDEVAPVFVPKLDVEDFSIASDFLPE